MGNMCKQFTQQYVKKSSRTSLPLRCLPNNNGFVQLNQSRSKKKSIFIHLCGQIQNRKALKQYLLYKNAHLV